MPTDYTKQLYNEVILDSAPWIANMPSSIEAVYYVAVNSDQVSAESGRTSLLGGGGHSLPPPPPHR